MKTHQLLLSILSATLVADLVLASSSARAADSASVAYMDPTGLWDYAYDGDFIAAAAGLPDGYGDSDAKANALDGTWQHNQGSKWDGTAPGDTLSVPGDPAGTPSTATGGPAGTSPGGAASLLDGSTDYIRIQDAGNPDQAQDGHDWCQQGQGLCVGSVAPTNTNRRVYFGHNINDGEFSGGLADELIMTITGVTISFRARIPDSTHSAALDDRIWFEDESPSFFDDSDFNGNLAVDGPDFLRWQRGFGTTTSFPDPNPTKSVGNADKNNTVNETDLDIWQEQFGTGAPGTQPWFEDDAGAPRLNGRGFPLANSRGIINVVQNSPGDLDNLVGFGLVTSTDATDICATSPASTICSATSGGLIMNNLNGDFHPVNNPFPVIDSVTAGGGTLNMLTRTDSELNDWEEYWITLENNGATAGNIEVKVYVNGSTTPTTFQVTLAGDNNAVYAGENDPFIEFGISNGGGFGSLDLDFFSYKLGIHTPVAALAAGGAVPEPSSLFLLMMGSLGVVGTRRRRLR